MKKLTEKEVKEVLTDMLKYFDELCRNNGIKYSLIGGSLIGAIRHKGIIPWDDDIDLVLTKKEYDKLIKTIKNHKNEKYQFVNYENNPTYYYPFIKLIDTRTTIIEDGYKEIENYGAYLDIFYYNNTPDNKIIEKIRSLRLLLRKLIISGYATTKFEKKDKYYIFKKIGALLAKIFGIKKIIKSYETISDKYTSKKTKYVISNWPCYGLNKEKQLKENLHEYIDCEFEGLKIMIFKEYDKILKTLFNNYMELPPVEKRINHNLKVYWK